MTFVNRWLQRLMGPFVSHNRPRISRTNRAESSESATETVFPEILAPGLNQSNFDFTRKRLKLLKEESARRLDGYLCSQPPYLPKLSQQVLEKLEKLWADYKNTRIVRNPGNRGNSNNAGSSNNTLRNSAISSNSSLTDNLTNSECAQFHFIKYLLEIIYEKSLIAINIVKSIDHQTDINHKENPRLKQLNEISLVFTYIHYEISTFANDVTPRDIPQNVDNSGGNNFPPSPVHNYRLTKIGAQKFWEENFEPSCLITKWSDFHDRFTAKFGEFDVHEKMQFEQAVDITKSGYISIYIFDVFVRLFAPWKNINKVWLTLGYSHAAFKVKNTHNLVKNVFFFDFFEFINALYDEAAQRLESLNIGSFLYRMSATKIGQWAIAYRTEYNVLQSIPEKQNLAEALIEGVSDGRYRYPDGRQENTDIGVLAVLAKDEYEEIEVPEENWYKPIGSTFEQCKLCYDHVKNVKLEPCGHLSCVECLRKWRMQEANKTTCPFCREEVRSSATIKFTYKPDEKRKKTPPKTIPEENSPKSALKTMTSLSPPARPPKPGRFSPIAPTIRAPDPPEF